jgi:uncharacterized protein
VKKSSIPAIFVRGDYTEPRRRLPQALVDIQENYTMIGLNLCSVSQPGGRPLSDNTKPQPGTIMWTDLTIPKAEEIRDFYQEVVGWQASEVPVGDYADFNMSAPGSDQPVVGICHARGDNANLPPQWLIYVIVEDLDRSVEAAKRLGGSVIGGIRDFGTDKMCVVRDPAGVATALYQKG